MVVCFIIGGFFRGKRSNYVCRSNNVFHLLLVRLEHLCLVDHFLAMLETRSGSKLFSLALMFKTNF